MSEEMKNNQPEKTGLDETRKSALMRYIAILFAVAFVLVLLSFLGQMRDSKSAISELSQSSSSAIARAEQLQEENLELTEENGELAQDKKFLQQQVEQLTEDAAAVQEEWDELSKELDSAREKQAKTLEAYEALLAAIESGKTENLEQYKEILGENGLKAYETLTKEVE